MNAPLNALQATRQLGYHNHVFVSWPHKIEKQGAKLVRQLAEDLADKFNNYGGGMVFLDELRLRDGYDWNAELRVNLCRSAVTIVVIVPTFFESDYCRIEWAIAELMQARRRNPEQTATYFFPLMLIDQGEPIPNELAALHHRANAFYPLLTFGKSPRSHPRWRQLVSDLAAMIRERLILLADRAPQWEADEALAIETKAKVFTWPQARSNAPASPALPTFVVEKQLT